MPEENVDHWLRLGRTRRKEGDTAGAIAAFRTAAGLDERRAEPYNAMGVALAAKGRGEEAERAFEEALSRRPGWADPWFNLGKARLRRGDQEGAEQAWCRAIEVQPDLDAARSALGAEYRKLRRFDDAARVLDGLKQPSGDEALWVGSYWVRKERFSRGLRLLRIAADLLPSDPEAHYARGVAAQRMFQLDEAIVAFRRCVALKPDYAEAWNNLGNSLKAQMQFGDAYDAYREGIRLRPEKANTHRNYLFAMQYDPDLSAADVLAAHRAYGARFARPGPIPKRNRDPDRRLKVGFVSSDLGAHPVGYFLAPVWGRHDREKFQFIAYAGPRPEDEVTERLRNAVEGWVPTESLSDDALADRIRSDEIDILVDLGGHTRGSRLEVFGHKPAPVQVTWAGYVGTTGLSTIDWLIGDERHTPEGAEAFAEERIWRLRDTYVCWEPPDVPETGGLPMLKNGVVTFGCFNNLPKINPAVIGLWARILGDLPGSRLVMITKSLADEAVRKDLTARFAACGVDPSRLELSGRIPRPQLLRTYAERIDLALDPVPYSGGLTTLEALWMGVPALTRGGDRFASRHSLGHMGAMGLEGFVGANAAEVHRLALRWANAPNELSAIRASLRGQMLASPLCDGHRFVCELERAFRGMWRDYVR